MFDAVPPVLNTLEARTGNSEPSGTFCRMTLDPPLSVRTSVPPVPTQRAREVVGRSVESFGVTEAPFSTGDSRPALLFSNPSAIDNP
jgi:hypothetical protein